MNEFLDNLSDFLAERPGFLPLLGILMILLNLLLQLVPGPGGGWLVDSNFFLHVGLVVALLGLLLIRPLSG